MGYVSVSTRNQHPEARLDALTATGCDKIFVDHASGTLSRRPQLNHVLKLTCRAGNTLSSTDSPLPLMRGRGKDRFLYLVHTVTRYQRHHKRGK
ncbi:recombinase family protein [Dietzia sp. CQ4]|uniref:recombinase family protein n=1 Tax=Dietzia sp. (strain CQ4) TaxID=370437 RepID=UPI0015FB4CE4|nr:recombinase family protein [Dietzia sp. CQ4]